MHSITISGKKDHEFEAAGVVYGRVSREEREGKKCYNCIIILK